MKKIFKSLMFLAIGAITLASCEDVPAPYTVPGGEVVPIDPEAKDGSAEKPYEILDLQTHQNAATVWVHGYIVGSIPVPPEGESTLLQNMTFTAEGASPYNICIAASTEETDYNNCVAVQIPAALRSELTLNNVPDNFGKEIWLKGTAEKFCGAPGLKNVSKYSFTQPEEIPAADPTGTGTKEDPWNVAAALKYITALSSSDAPADIFYTKGKISSVDKMGQSGSIQFKMSDDGTANNELLVYWCDNLGKKPFTALTDLSVGDEVIVCGTVKNYKGTTPEYNSGSYLVYLNGQEAEEGDDDPSTGDDDPGTSTTSEYLSIANLPTDITMNNYGTQNVASESSWLSWTWNGVDFKGARICKATDANGGGIQVQGNASDATKQGFIFNSSAWTSDIQKITLVLKVKINEDPTKMFDPGYTLYAGSEAHPTATDIEPTITTEDVDGFRVYTQVFDLANASAKFFTIANNKQGVLYIDKIYVE